MNRFVLNNIKTDFETLGDVSEFENPIDRFIIWAEVDFDIDGQNFQESVRFNEGYPDDRPMWENYKTELFQVSHEQDGFLSDCLIKAGHALSELKEELRDDN